MDIASTFDREPFRHTDPKYKCCCGIMHVKDACRLIAGLSILGIIGQILSLIFDFRYRYKPLKPSSSFTWWSFVVHLIVILTIIAIIAAFIWAIKTENEKLLLPYLAYLAVIALISLGIFAICLWSLIDPHSPPARVANNIIVNKNDTMLADQGIKDNQTAIRVTSALGCVSAIIGIAICVWFGLVVYKYYCYLRDMKEARNPKNVVHHEISTLKKGIQ